MSQRNIIVPLPQGFDPRRHGAALVKKIATDYGDGYEVTSIDMGKMEAYAVRHAAMTEMTVVESGGGQPKAFEARLGPNLRKPSDGDKAAAMFEEQHPGYFLVKFEPYLGKATLAKLSDDEARARGAVATSLGVKPWDVMVQSNKMGGYDIKLPPTYVPSKHDAKLQEVAESVVGQMGWYVQTDPNKLTARIVPSDPPTFPESIAYPLKKLGRGDLDRVAFGMVLPDPGEDKGEDIVLDWTASAFGLIAGTPGSGKVNYVGTQVISQRGRTTIGELTRDDKVLCADGSFATITGFSERQMVDAYRVSFSDGQSTIVGPDHQWLVSSRQSRSAYAPSRVERRSAAYDRDMERVHHIREVLRSVEPGSAGTLTDIARLLGWSDTSLFSYSIPKEMEYETSVLRLDGHPSKHFDTIMFNDWLFDNSIPGQVVASLSKCGQWATAKTIAAELFGLDDPPRHRIEAVRNAATLSGADVRVLPAGRTVRARHYPVDEVLDWLASDIERRAGTSDSGVPCPPLEDVMTTRQMMDSLKVSGDDRLNYAVRVAPAYVIDEAELPIDPWLFGVWLGDGSTRTSTLIVGKDDFEWMSTMVEYSKVNKQTATKRDGASTYSMVFEAEGLTRTGLSEIGVLGAKHIPDLYMFASKEQRLAVLQGLMDTDGTVDSKGACELALSDARLANDALRLIRTLGIKASMTVSEAGYKDDKGNYIRCKDRHRIHFTTTEQVFRMPRKVARLPKGTRATQDWNYVTSIEPVGMMEMRCVKVDHPTHLFVVEDSILTHNSVTLNAIISDSLSNGSEVVVVDDKSKAVDFLWVKDWLRPGGWGCDSLEHAVAALGLVYEEGQKRAKQLAEMRLNNWLDMPKDKRFKPILVVVDEVSALLVLDPVPKGIPKDHPLMVEVLETNLARQMLASLINKILAELRFVGVRMILSTQATNANTGVGPSMRTKMGNFILQGVAPSKSARGQIFPDETAVPHVPENVKAGGKRAKGVGVALLEGQQPHVYKSFFAPIGEYQKALESLSIPKTGSAPTASQINKFVPKLDEGGSDTPPAKSSRGERAPSGKSAAAVAAEMGDAAGMAMHDGSLGTGYAKANAIRHMAANPNGKTKTQKAEDREEAAYAAQAGDVESSHMKPCPECGAWVEPWSGVCSNGHSHPEVYPEAGE